MSERKPPRFVPTLTTVLELPAEPAAAPQAEAPAADPAQAIAIGPQMPASETDAFALEEQLLHRVLQRVDLSLEERLSDTVSAVIQQQLDNMIPKLRDEIEAVLRELISEALARELSDNTGSTPAFGP
ncbi:hypothetical protein GCM10023165_28170 [Variovorax defluvii]|uniref:DUF2486 family protein n=2 Tax=Variovorax defluvii TaxID=913761 RepID=A0ABP8HUK2_9BURK